jgi:hypothetical protein
MYFVATPPLMAAGVAGLASRSSTEGFAPRWFGLTRSDGKVRVLDLTANLSAPDQLGSARPWGEIAKGRGRVHGSAPGWFGLDPAAGVRWAPSVEEREAGLVILRDRRRPGRSDLRR